MKYIARTVLYVEDDEDIAQEVAEFLSRRVQQLYIAKDGQEGLELYKKYKPDIIITDVQMPRMSGLEMIAKIRSEDHEVPIIITSAYNDTNFLLSSIDLGVDAYLLKPLDFTMMIERIKKLIEPLEMRKKIHQLNEKLIKLNASLEAEIAKAVQKHTELLTKMNEDMKQRAFYDSLTGLPNRAFIYEIFEKELIKAKRKQQHLGICFIDLDNFKEVNDTYGHLIGDQLLVAVAKVLKSSIRGSDSIGRLGGDEFLLIASDVYNKEGVYTLIQKVRQKLNKAFFIGDLELHLSCSIGISCYPDDAQEMSKLIECADIAMYAVKRGHKNGIAFYSDLKN